MTDTSGFRFTPLTFGVGIVTPFDLATRLTALRCEAVRFGFIEFQSTRFPDCLAAEYAATSAASGTYPAL